jgi:Tol biopolymer transport system component
MNIDGTEQTRLTDNPANDIYNCFSPDGSKIAFTSNRDGNDEVYIMNSDGTDQKRLTNNTVMDWWPRFSL